MKEKIKKILLLILFIFFLVEIGSTYYLFKLDQDIQNLYERKNSLDIAYTTFLAQDPITKINPWQALSDETLKKIYRNAHFFIYEEEPPSDVLDKITSRASYNEQIGELQKITDTAKSRVLNNIKEKQNQQTQSFWYLLISQIVVGVLGVVLGINSEESREQMQFIDLVILIAILLVTSGFFYLFNIISNHFSTLADIATILAASTAIIAILEWRKKIPRIKTKSFPFIIGSRNDRRNYIFYLYCVNHGNATVHLFDFKMILRDKSNHEIELKRIVNDANLVTPKFFTSENKEIKIEYNKKKLPLRKPLKQGEPIEGFVIFEEENNSTKFDLKILESVEIIAIDSLGGKHKSYIPKTDVDASNIKAMSLLKERSGIRIL